MKLIKRWGARVRRTAAPIPSESFRCPHSVACFPPDSDLEGVEEVVRRAVTRALLPAAAAFAERHGADPALLIKKAGECFLRASEFSETLHHYLFVAREASADETPNYVGALVTWKKHRTPLAHGAPPRGDIPEEMIVVSRIAGAING